MASTKTKKTSTKPTGPVKLATPVPLKAAQASGRGSERSGFSTDDAFVGGGRMPNLNPSAPGVSAEPLRYRGQLWEEEG